MLFIDLDGTLLDDTARHYATYAELLSTPDLRGVPLPEREYWGLKREGKPPDDALRKSRLFPTKFKEFGARFAARVETPEMLALDRVRSGVETALGKLYTKTPIVLITQRRDGEELKNQLAQLGLAKYFVEVLFGAPPSHRRVTKDDRWQHKASLLKARYRILPTDALWIGDTENDVRAARSLKFEVWLLEGGHRNKEQQIKADPDRIEADLAGSLKHLLPGGRWQR
ncbi:MAG: HAD family phosphatase [Deltaproteobacteria bacterium]|nr:HAD family phosphatase [Deltaproteobacteria bacterium]